MYSLSTALKKSSLIFWDFDGVIKDSVNVKTLAYEKLFLPYGEKVAFQVRQHHEKNGGVSRYEKIPLYLEFAGEPNNTEKINLFCKKFSQLVVQAVIDSPWVPGVLEYLLDKHDDQYFVLVTATPKNEIEQILASLKLSHCFREIYGAPTHKAKVIYSVLDRLKYSRDHTVMIGDSESDLQAAQASSVPFLLRRTPLNCRLQENFSGVMFNDFIDESI